MILFTLWTETDTYIHKNGVVPVIINILFYSKTSFLITFWFIEFPFTKLFTSNNNVLSEEGNTCTLPRGPDFGVISAFVILASPMSLNRHAVNIWQK